LTSIDEIMALAGVDHITIAPALLQELSTTPATSLTISSLFDGAAPSFDPQPRMFGKDEAGYRIAFTRSENGEGERKLTQVRMLADGGG
jgi:transaldolase